MSLRFTQTWIRVDRRMMNLRWSKFHFKHRDPGYRAKRLSLRFGPKRRWHKDESAIAFGTRRFS